MTSCAASSSLLPWSRPRVRAREIWRVAETWLEQAQDDATVLAIRDMERAGIDILRYGKLHLFRLAFAVAREAVAAERDGE